MFRLMMWLVSIAFFILLGWGFVVYAIPAIIDWIDGAKQWSETSLPYR